MRFLLVMTSTYPRWKADTEPAFVQYLSEQLASHFKIIILAPHYPGARTYEEQQGMLIYRFRYFFSFAEHLSYNGGIITNLKNNRFKYLLVPFFIVSEFVHAAYLCIKHDIEIIHAHWMIPQGLLAVLIRKLSHGKIKVLCTSHGGDLYSLGSGFMKALNQFVIKHCDHTTVVSKAMKKDVIRMGASNSDITVQSMGVDLLQSFTVDEKKDKTVDLLFVGRLVEKKGVPILLNAVSQVKEHFPSIRLSIVGDGPDKMKLLHQAASLGLSENIEFTGSIPNHEIPTYYQQSRIAVVPSTVAVNGDQEGLGLVAVEALGCGCATIVSGLPALEDVVEDEKTGLVFKVNDAADLAKKILRLCENEQLRLQLGNRGREYVANKFDWGHVGKQYLEILNRLYL